MGKVAYHEVSTYLFSKMGAGKHHLMAKAGFNSIQSNCKTASSVKTKT